MTENTENIIVSEVLSDEYEVISCVKSGEKSEAYILYDRMCQRKAFMKIGEAEVIENEARMLAGLRRKGIPEVYGCFEHKGRSCLIRQYINGKTLREQINENGAFTVSKAVEVGIAVCEILSELHEKNPPVIHRDIKSDNIVLTPEGEVFIIDFGISREYDFDADRDTQVMGTPVMAPPEQFGYSQTDQRSDVYCVGVLLNELVTGSAKINLSGLPMRFATIIKRCTEFAPAKRFESAVECGKALRRLRKKSFADKLLPTAAVCLLAAGIVLASVFRGAENETAERIPLDESYPGDYALSSTIPLSVLKKYEGDIKIVLEIDADERYDYANFIPIAVVGKSGEWVNLVDEISCENSRNYDGFIEVEYGQTECTLILSGEAADRVNYDGIGFQAVNVTIKSAELSSAE